MLNSKDVETTKDLVISAIYKAMNPFCLDTSNKLNEQVKETKINVAKAFDIVIREMKVGG